MPDIDLKRINNSDADPKVKEVYKLLRKYQRQPERKEWITKREDLWDAVYEYDEKSTIWTPDERRKMEEKGMIPLAINDLYKGVQGSAAIVTDQKPGVMFLPVGSGDLYVAELMKRAFDQVWDQNDGGTEVYEFVRETKVGGLGSIDVKHDPAKGIFGKVVFGNFDPSTLYFDMQKSRKSDLSDTPVLKAHLVTKTYAKETYEGVTDADLTFTALEKAEEGVKKTDTAGGVDNYTRDEQDEPPAGPEDELEEKEDVWEIEAHMLKREREYWLVFPTEAGFDKKVFTKDQKAEAEEAAKQTSGSKLMQRIVEKRTLRIIVGKKLIKQEQDGQEVDELVNPYDVDVDGDPILNIVTLTHDKTRKGKPVSPTVFAKEVCKERNKRRAQAIYVVSKNVDAPLVAASGMVKWHKDAVHGDWLEVDKATPWKPDRLSPGTVSTEMMSMEAVAKNDVDDMYDMHDVMKGKLPPGDPSGRTVLALQDMAGMMSKPFTRTCEAALVRIGKVVMAITLKTWPREKWERLIESDEMTTWIPEKLRKPVNPIEAMNGNAPQEPDEGMKQQIAAKWKAALDLIRPVDMSQPPGISLLDVDVRVAAGSTMPTNRMARAALTLDMVKQGVLPAEAGLEYMDDPKADKYKAIIEANKQAQMQAEMMKGGDLPAGGLA